MFALILKSLVLVLAGVILLRIAGRKTISQMSLAQTVVMISIGSIILQPIIESSTIRTIVAATVFIGALVLMEYLQLKFNFIEKVITGKSKMIIENGQLNIQNMKKLRFTVDQLEMRLRQQGITNIKDVKTATLETNGQIGYELQDDAKPLTIRDFKKLMNIARPNNSNSDSNNLFSEINHTTEKSNPDYLQ